MNKNYLSFSTLVSFNELAWIAVFALLLFSTVSVKKYNNEVRQHNNILLQLKSTDQELLKTKQNLLAKDDELKKTKNDLDEALQQLKFSHLSKEPVLKQDLILKGGLKYVVFIVDRSGSMAQGGSWKKTSEIIRTWLEVLPIEHAALIYFNDTVSAFPSNETYLDMRGTQNIQNKNTLLKQFNLIKPKGNTNTLDALRKAYEYKNTDTIILFTDGFPDIDGKNHFNDGDAKAIYDLCQEHKLIPVNTIGLGSYFDSKLGGFLKRLPEITGGSFIGL